ncbi:hypothetical protein AB1E22_10465 [Buttiauxella gaviniae]|uniref:Uncharacterized protein n=1 Tax=Buttiauxella gaviniae TaxID=82990 RepID=A0ABV3NUM1_9ENTR
MDVAKAIVAGVVIGVVGGFLTLATAPVVFTISLVIGIGILLNIQLNNLDDEFHLSANLKVKLHNALSEEHRMKEWNQLHSSTLFNFLVNTSD